MKNAYVRFNNRKYVKFIEKIFIFIKKILIKISVEKLSINRFEDTFIILIPKYKNYNTFIKTRIVNQINKCLSSNKIDNLLIDNNVNFLSEEFKQYKTLTGKYLMKNLIFGILEYIFHINKTNTELENIYVFINEYSKCNIKIIENMCKKFKTVNIITENLKYYKRLENSLYNSGILITVSNNKRKSARNAKYIINFDFKKEVFEKYSINMDAIIINLTDENELVDKFFRGVLINNFELTICEDYMNFINEFYGNVNKKLYLESLIINSSQINIENLFIKYKCKITELIGVRGIIQNNEFQIYN